MSSWHQRNSEAAYSDRTTMPGQHGKSDPWTSLEKVGKETESEKLGQMPVFQFIPRPRPLWFWLCCACLGPEPSHTWSLPLEGHHRPRKTHQYSHWVMPENTQAIFSCRGLIKPQWLPWERGAFVSILKIRKLQLTERYGQSCPAWEWLRQN